MFKTVEELRHQVGERSKRVLVLLENLGIALEDLHILTQNELFDCSLLLQNVRIQTLKQVLIIRFFLFGLGVHQLCSDCS